MVLWIKRIMPYLPCLLIYFVLYWQVEYSRNMFHKKIRLIVLKNLCFHIIPSSDWYLIFYETLLCINYCTEFFCLVCVLLYKYNNLKYLWYTLLNILCLCKNILLYTLFLKDYFLLYIVIFYTVILKNRYTYKIIVH